MSCLLKLVDVRFKAACNGESLASATDLRRVWGAGSGLTSQASSSGVANDNAILGTYDP